MNSILINPPKNSWAHVLKRPAFDSKHLEAAVSQILLDVKTNGDTAIKYYTSQYDKITLDHIKVTREEIDHAENLVSPELKNAISIALKNIWKFHEAQLETPAEIETSPGIFCWRKSISIEKVGLYIPGGITPLFSTLLMLGVPAVIAGCKEITVCTPPSKNGTVHPAILYTAKVLGIENIYKAGGAQAIAAMAYGTEMIPQVDKIFGPGNQYVTCAKQLVNLQGIAIDMPAGPSELAIYADHSSNPVFVAADLLSQAEHGPDSQVIIISNSKEVLNKVLTQITLQQHVLLRRDFIEHSLVNSQFIVIDNVDEAFSMINRYAPEHLIIATDNAKELCHKVINAGSVFLGHYSPESAGDYASGTNHTLPTNGFAKSYSGVSVDSFVKKITFQRLSKEGLQGIAESVATMAEAEGLDAHKNAVQLRF